MDPLGARLVLAVRTADTLLVTAVSPDDLSVTDGHNLGGEPRDDVEFDLPADDYAEVDAAIADELTRRGAWARCVQCIGALDAAAELSVAHTRERVQFGRPLSKFQAVQHTLAQMAGEIERARAATELAVAAATDHGFDSPQTDYAVTVAKVVLGRVVPAVSHHRAPAARRHRRDDRAPAVVGDEPGAQLDRRVRQHRALRPAAGPVGAGARWRRRGTVGCADVRRAGCRR